MPLEIDSSNNTDHQAESSRPDPIPEGKISKKKVLSKKARILLFICLPIFLCSATFLASISFAFYKIISEVFQANHTLATYLQNLSEDNINDAYFLLTPQLKSEVTLEEYRSIIEQNSDFQFEGYQYLHMRNFYFFRQAKKGTENHGSANVLSVRITAAIFFENDETMTIRALLEKHNGQWMVSKIDLDSPSQNQNSVSSLPSSLVYLSGKSIGSPESRLSGCFCSN